MEAYQDNDNDNKDTDDEEGAGIVEGEDEDEGAIGKGDSSRRVGDSARVEGRESTAVAAAAVVAEEEGDESSDEGKGDRSEGLDKDKDKSKNKVAKLCHPLFTMLCITLLSLSCPPHLLIQPSSPPYVPPHLFIRLSSPPTMPSPSLSLRLPPSRLVRSNGRLTVAKSGQGLTVTATATQYRARIRYPP